MTQLGLNRITLLFQVAAVILLTATLGLMSVVSILGYEQRLLPEIQAKALTVGHELTHNISQAVTFSGALHQIRGADAFFDKAMDKNHELAYLAIRSGATGQTLFQRAAAATETDAAATIIDLPIPIVVNDIAVGSLHLGLRTHYARQILHELSYDVLTVCGISLLITFGLLSFVIQTGVAGRLGSFLGMVDRLGRGDLRPCRRNYGSDRIGRLLDRLNDDLETVQRQYRDTLANIELIGPIADHERRALLRIGENNHLDEPAVDETPLTSHLMALRLVVFIFFLAEELVRPFLPLFIKQVAGGESGSQSLMVSLPLSLFLLFAALAQPLGGVWVERVGRRRVFLIAAVVSVTGLMLTAMAGSYGELLAWRSLSAVGYGVVFVACQGYAVEHTTPATRASGMAMFVGGIMAAALCGPSVGGIIADHFGFRATLVIAAGITVLAIAAGHVLMGRGETVALAPRPVQLREIFMVISNRRMLALIVLVAVPAKVVLSGVLFYLTPIYLTTLGEPQSAVGRVMMVYGVATVVLGPISARYADLYWHHRHWFVGVGALVSGCGLLPLLWMPGEFWILVGGIAALGIGQAISLSPQLALVPELAAEECHEVGSTVVLGVFRLVERAGGALGPLLAGLLADGLGNAGAVAWIGQGVLVMGAVFLLSMQRFKSRRAT